MKTPLLFVFALLTLTVARAQYKLPDGSIIFSAHTPPPANPTASPQAGPQARSGNNYNIPFDTVLFNPTLGTKAFDIVICLDGVINNSDIGLADNYIDSFVARLQSIAHYGKRFKYINIYRIARLSNQRGASHGFAGNNNVDNRYGSTFNAYNLDRLLMPRKTDTLFADVNEFVPEYDLVLMLAYDKKYGGSGLNMDDGRKVASFSIDEETFYHLGDEVIVHEMQHVMTFAGHTFLVDEYEDSAACSIYDTLPVAYLDGPNTTNDTVNRRKWQYFIDAHVPNIGFYDSAAICPGNYRPSHTCIMREAYIVNHSQFYGVPPFCPVCGENSTAYFDSVINPVYYTSPPPVAYTGSYTFEARVDTPPVNTFRYQWLLDGAVLTTGTLSVNINFQNLSQSASHTLKFVCTDMDDIIRDTTLWRPWVTEWHLEADTTGMGVDELFDRGISIYPNPATDVVNIQLTELSAHAFLKITAADGRVVTDRLPLSQKTTAVSLAAVPAGIYFITVQNGPQKLVRRIVKQ